MKLKNKRIVLMAIAISLVPIASFVSWYIKNHTIKEIETEIELLYEPDPVI